MTTRIVQPCICAKYSNQSKPNHHRRFLCILVGILIRNGSPGDAIFQRLEWHYSPAASPDELPAHAHGRIIVVPGEGPFARPGIRNQGVGIGIRQRAGTRGQDHQGQAGNGHQEPGQHDFSHSSDQRLGMQAPTIGPVLDLRVDRAMNSPYQTTMSHVEGNACANLHGSPRRPAPRTGNGSSTRAPTADVSADLCTGRGSTRAVPSSPRGTRVPQCARPVRRARCPHCGWC